MCVGQFSGLGWPGFHSGKPTAGQSNLFFLQLSYASLDRTQPLHLIAWVSIFGNWRYLTASTMPPIAQKR